MTRLNLWQRRSLLALGVWVAACATGCQAFGESAEGPGMTLVYGSLIDGKSISAKSAVLPNGTRFADPGSVAGGKPGAGKTWRNVPTSTMAASGDYRGLPEWVEFVWQEPSYPGLDDKDFPTREAFSRAVKEKYAKLPFKTQRLEIKRRVPQSVVDEVIASKRVAPPGKVANKSLWFYIFWTPDGIKMRWHMRDQAVPGGGFGAVVREGGDDLDQYNR